MKTIEILNLIIESIFLGYCLYTLLRYLSLIFLKKTPQIIPNVIDGQVILTSPSIFNDTIDSIVIIVFRFSALVNVLMYIFNLIKSTLENEVIWNTDRMFGPHWYAYWIYTFTFLILPHFLWIPTLIRSKVFRIFIALMLLFTLSIEKFIIIMTTIERDYIPSGWVYENDYSWIAYLITSWIIKMSIFIVIILITHKIKNRKASIKY